MDKDKEPLNHALNAQCTEVLGARMHNLQRIDVSFPKNKLTVITGVSGSGKSSLAFDTINAEGQRRYRESFSIYIRRFLENFPRPDVDTIKNLPPVIAIAQQRVSRSPRSTVGTTTEIYDFMRLLYARVGNPGAAQISSQVSRHSKEQIVEHIFKTFIHQNLTFMAPVVKYKTGAHYELLKSFMRDGFSKVRIDGGIVDLSLDLTLNRYRKHSIDLVIDHINIDHREAMRITQAVELAIQYGKGSLVVCDQNQQDHYFYHKFTDPAAGELHDLPEPNLFSFNSPSGACSICNGLGEVYQVEFATIIPNKQLSIAQGAILPLGPYKKNLLFKKIEALLLLYHYSIHDAVSKLPNELLNLLLFGNVAHYPFGKVAHAPEPFYGIIDTLCKQQERLESQDVHSLDQMHYRAPCPVCGGSRLNEVARSFQVVGKSIADLVQMDLKTLQAWFADLPDKLNREQYRIACDVLKEIQQRIDCLIDLGLAYLTLNRSLHTLSGGEAQRIHLARQIGTKLTGILYILDEPSIGLHQRDNARLIAALKQLRDIGNTILVVEHDRDMMLAADYLIELGPQAGVHGGRVVSFGSVPEFLGKPSITSDFLSHRMDFPIPSVRRPGNGQWLTIQNCCGHNLKGVNFSLPLGRMVCVTGVSGSGKSTLIHGTLVPIIKRHLYKSHVKALDYDKVTGLEHVRKIIEVDQLPIGRTARSNPSTYTGIFTAIRNFFALLPDAKVRGYNASRFSFNLHSGQCSECEGMGVKRVDMGILSELAIPCQTCMGKRYNAETLQVQYRGKSIADVLDMTVTMALSFFQGHASITSKLKVLEKVGLGYITLGQHATSLSGGEIQRIKLATELALKETGHTLYILDEPSTGLHFKDIFIIMETLGMLVDQGHSVLVIEHNMDIIKMADYIIDLGPESGAQGGCIVAEGTPEQIATVAESYTGCFLKKELGMPRN